MSKLTEKDVLVAYNSYLAELVHQHAPHVFFADAFADAQEELLLCIRCYREGFHGKFWNDYTRPKISERLKELQKKQNTQKRSERIHLDARMDEDSGDTFGKLLLVEQAKVTRVELFELISCAPKQARKVARMIVQKYTRSEIETMLQLSPGDYQRALLQLRTAWEEYNKEIF